MIINAAFKTMLDNTEDMVFVKNMNLEYIAASVPFVKMVGKERVEEILGKSDEEIFTNKDLAARYAADDRKLLAGGKNLENYIEPITDEDGHHRYGTTSKYILKDENNNQIGILGVTRDITRNYVSRKHYQRLEVAAKMDQMTMLLNRETTMEEIRSILKRQSGQLHALFMLDVDNFKELNDTMGHQAGDRYLVLLAEEIRKCFRDSDVKGRIGGDEFFVLMQNIQEISIVQKKAILLLERIQAIGTKYPCVGLTGSIGISLYPYNGSTVEDLYAKADASLYQAKRDGKNKFVIAKE